MSRVLYHVCPPDSRFRTLDDAIADLKGDRLTRLVTDIVTVEVEERLRSLFRGLQVSDEAYSEAAPVEAPPSGDAVADARKDIGKFIDHSVRGFLRGEIKVHADAVEEAEEGGWAAAGGASGEGEWGEGGWGEGEWNEEDGGGAAAGVVDAGAEPDPKGDADADPKGDAGKAETPDVAEEGTSSSQKKEQAPSIAAPAPGVGTSDTAGDASTSAQQLRARPSSLKTLVNQSSIEDYFVCLAKETDFLRKVVLDQQTLLNSQTKLLDGIDVAIVKRDWKELPKLRAQVDRLVEMVEVGDC